MKIVYINSDLFTSTSSLAHCVSEDLAMGAGIALQFKKRFGRVDELRSQGKLVGQVSYLIDKERYIFYLITKEKYYYKPTYETLRLSLIELRDQCLANDVKELSIPKIGCGLDRLEWSQVSKLIESIFSNTSIIIKVYVV